MKRIVSTVFVLIAAGSAWPAFAQGMGGYGGGGGSGGGHGHHGSRGGADHGSRASGDPEGTAEDLRLQGKCDKAVPMLRGMIDRNGAEISQLNLGLCLLDLAKAETDAQRAADQRKEGASWILRAANAGFNKAEDEAVMLYLDGTGVAADPVEAAKWALLYHNNGIRLAIGLPDVTPDTKSRLDAALTRAQREEAQVRADSWTSTAQTTDR
jgi:hypothetical protein